MQEISKEAQVEIDGSRFSLVHLVYSKEENLSTGHRSRGGSATSQWPGEGVLWLSRGSVCLGCQEGLGTRFIHVELSAEQFIPIA